jgi:hypothetical protein
MTAPPNERDAPRRLLRQCIGTRYRPGVPPIKRKTPQHTIAVDDDLWQDCLKIARKRHKTLTAEILDFLIRYRARYKDLLSDDT